MPRGKPAQVAEGDAIDETAETATLTGPVAESHDPVELLRRVAKQLGHKPKEEWDRDPESWVDEFAFLEQTPKQVEDLRTRNRELQERSERSARAAAEAIEEDRRRTREQAQKVIRESDDPDERVRAAKELEGPPPETRAWIAKNPWFDTDPDAKALAVSAVIRAEQRGANIPDALAAGEDAVKKRFPEYFATGTEQRLSDVRRAAPNPPAVQPGTRAVTTQTKEKGFADIPAADRQAFRSNLLKHYTSRGVSQTDAEARYARSYWGTGVSAPDDRPSEKYPLSPQTNVWAKRGGRAG